MVLAVPVVTSDPVVPEVTDPSVPVVDPGAVVDVIPDPVVAAATVEEDPALKSTVQLPSPYVEKDPEVG